MRYLLAILAILILSSTTLVLAQGDGEYHPGLAHLPNLGEPKGERISIAFITFSLNVSDYSWYVFDGMRERLASYGKPYDVRLTAAGGHGDHEGLLQLAREAIIGGADILVIHPTQLLLNTPISELARDAGIPLIWFNVGPRGMLDPDEFPAMSYVGYEHLEGGERVGAFLADFVPENRTVGLLRLFLGDYADERLIGAANVLAERRPDIKIVEEFAEGSRTKGNELATAMITGVPDLHTIFGGNSASAMGAAAAVENLGVNVGVIGYGCIQEEVEALLEGRVLGCIMRDPWDNGRIIGDVIIKWWEGREDEIKPAYATFQKLIYSPDLVYKYVNPKYWQPWVDQHGMVESGCPEENMIEEVALGFHDPEHAANCPWIDRFR